ncbi:MAG TPA: DUF4382 domain-containing protein [Steroidobacteraceae bacterium]|nr:DUF4382 domain-containing protein [Steroidobacteraceae bacterium]
MRSRTAPFAASLAALAVALGGCSTRTNVAGIGNVPPLYTHVYLTAQAVWFNSSATAGPDDGGWAQFPLATPVTVDLVANSGGNFALLFTDLKVAPGSYSQVRFIPVDASAPLTSSAQTLGATYNMEADYVDSSGLTHQLPLELLNPDKGLGIRTSLNVPFGNIGAALGAAGAAGAPGATGATGMTGATTGTTFGATTGTTFGNMGTGVTGSTIGTGLPTTTAEFALDFDGARDLAGFTYGGVNAVLLSSHAAAYDLSQVGGIQGQLTLINLTGLSSANGTPGVEVNAEVLSTDGTRHVVVARAPVASDGTFTLYPLPTSTASFNALGTNTTNLTSYDLVIHGAGIATIIIKDVQIPPVAPVSGFGSFGNGFGAGFGSTTGIGGLGNTGTGTTGTTFAPATTTTSPTSTIGTNPDTTPPTPTNLVSVGTLLPRAVSSYTANIANAGAPLPAGAEVEFYQTLPGSGEVPYVIEAEPIDPFNQVLANPQALSSGTVDSGTYVLTGATVTVVSAAPQEGAGTYQVAATAPSYANGALGVTVAAPTATGVTAASPVTVGALALASGTTAASVAASVQTASAGKYDHGEIMLSQNGQLIASAPLDAVLASGGGTVQLTGVPGGAATSVYYVSVRAWNSSDPSGTLTRQWYPDALDLRSATSASFQLTVN